MTKREKINVTKASGEKVPFQKDKLIRSLMRSGAAKEEAERISDEVTANLEEGFPTKAIYKTAFRMLKNYSRPVAARYKLKNAMMELGPSGFPFEQFVSHLLRFQGFKTQVGTIQEGHCVNHEIDIIAERDNDHFMIECKFHNRPGVISDVKTPLYIQSRYLDVLEEWQKDKNMARKNHQGWVITNTRFSADAMQFGRCKGLNLVAWDYPNNNGLRNWINESGLHPITCLTTLSVGEKQQLLEKNIVLCKDIYESDRHLQKIGIKPPRLYKIIEECRELCEPSFTNLSE